MKKLKLLSVIVVLVCSSVTAIAQGKYFTREGFISFHSDTEIEQIHAVNYKVTSVLDTETGKMEFAVLMKAFEFEKALMEEHFNENYVESNLFPKAIFKGQIKNANDIDWTKEGEQEIEVAGQLTIHGVTNDVTHKAKIIIEGGKIIAVADFVITITDYDINIPKVVIKNIAEDVKVEVKMDYQKLTKS